MEAPRSGRVLVASSSPPSERTPHHCFPPRLVNRPKRPRSGVIPEDRPRRRLPVFTSGATAGAALSSRSVVSVQPPTNVPVVVVMTGLAAAGKSTVAGPLAAVLGVPLLSKDKIMEALHDAVGVQASAAWRSTLSRTADSALVSIAAALDGGAVLDNFWRK